MFGDWTRSSTLQFDEVKFSRSRFPYTAYAQPLMAESVWLMCIVGLLCKEFLSQTKVVWSLGSRSAMSDSLNHHLLSKSVFT